ncbi:MAG: glycosyltransferase family 4 protein [Chitinophagales bacterium]|nr:glycosyltransferase family 4 protein [Chitinophagales bacterium]
MTIFLISLYYKVNEKSGANIRFDETAKYLIKKGWNVKMIVIEGETPSWCKDKNQVISIKKYSAFPSPIRRFIYFLKLSLLFFKIPKSIIVNDFIPFSVWSLKKHYHYQLVHDIRDFSTFRRGTVPSFNAKFQMKQWQNSQKIISVSEYTKKELVEICNISPKNIDIVYNGINQNFINFSEKLERKIDFLYIGVFEDRKNHKNLTIALNLLKQKGTHFSAEFVGRDQGTLEEIKELRSKLGLEDSLIINNNVLTEKELIEKYNQTKVFVSSSLYEGFGIPLIEAFASGCSVVCTDMEVFKEVCENNALYFNAELPKDIAQTLYEALKRDKNADRDEYKNYAKNKFQWKFTLSEMDNIFKKLIN